MKLKHTVAASLKLGVHNENIFFCVASPTKYDMTPYCSGGFSPKRQTRSRERFRAKTMVHAY